jgi:peptidoglycan/xylan/chitin deacetylase (PgdA/CDA1 family)
MTVAQIKELMADPLVTIGAHSHTHRNLRKIPKLFDCVAHIASDTEQMMQWFQNTLGFAPTSFCFPYNDDLDGMYRGLLRKHGFTDFYGHERTAIESLLPTTAAMAV